MKMQTIAMKIQGVAMTHDSTRAYVILQDCEKNRTVPIMVGPFEASAIIIELEGIVPPRPLTHDLIVNLFKNHNFVLEYVELFSNMTEAINARMVYKHGFMRHVQELRPSDAIALAVRCKVPVYAEDSFISTYSCNSNDVQNGFFCSDTNDEYELEWTPKAL